MSYNRDAVFENVEFVQPIIFLLLQGNINLLQHLSCLQHHPLQVVAVRR